MSTTWWDSGCLAAVVEVSEPFERLAAWRSSASYRVGRALGYVSQAVRILEVGREQGLR